MRQTRAPQAGPSLGPDNLEWQPKTQRQPENEDEEVISTFLANLAPARGKAMWADLRDGDDDTVWGEHEAEDALANGYVGECGQAGAGRAGVPCGRVAPFGLWDPAGLPPDGPTF